MEGNTIEENTIEETPIEENTMNTDWISEFEYNDREYTQLYQTNLNKIKLCLIYVDRSYTIVHIRKDLLDIFDNMLNKVTLLAILRKNMNYNSKKYRPISILQYNINLKPQNIKNFLQNIEKYNFLTPKNSIENIYWDSTIKLFEDMKTLYIIFYEKWCTNNKGTRKIYLEHKKKLKRRKTKKKQLKDKRKI